MPLFRQRSVLPLDKSRRRVDKRYLVLHASRLLLFLWRRKISLLCLLVTCWTFVTTDSYFLWWLWWKLVSPPTVDRALVNDCPARNYTLPIVVVIPLIASQIDRAEWTLKRWGDPRYTPCSAEWTRQVSLAFYFDRPLEETRTARAVQMLKEILHSDAVGKAVNRCFTQVSFKSAELSERETRNSHGMDFVHNLVQTGGSNRQFEKAFAVFGGGKWRHMLYMEPDTWPIRENWLQRVWQESEWGEFWMRGTVMRYPAKFNIGWEPWRREYQRHLNGNAIYALDDKCFDRYRHLVAQRFGDGAFDVAMRMYRGGVGGIMVYQAVASRFVVTEVMVDVGVTAVKEEDLRAQLPRTWLVHGKFMHVKYPWFNFMQY